LEHSLSWQLWRGDIYGKVSRARFRYWDAVKYRARKQAAISSVGRLLRRTVLCQLFSVILLPPFLYSVLGIANPTTEHQPHTQTSYLIRDFF
jgi:hypothetical protein